MLETKKNSQSVPLKIIKTADWKTIKKSLSDEEQKLAKIFRFKANNGSLLRVVNGNGDLVKVYLGYDENGDPRNLMRSFAAASTKLTSMDIHLEDEFSESELEQVYLGWELAGYEYPQNKKKKLARLFVENKTLAKKVEQKKSAIFLARDLVNSPNNQMHPEDLAKSAKKVAKDNSADLEIISGKTLEKDFPAIYAVGKGSSHPPILIDLKWGDEKHPKVCIVGKGVCFDTGGYNLKPNSGIRNMKKDMGGGAIALALSKLIMESKLPIRLHLLIPAVENMVSDRAFLPGDVIESRKGLQIEIDNTDAEGRLVLCDALCYASEEDPELIIDFATLTGACRVALGQDLPGFFTDSNSLAESLTSSAESVQDPLWRLPLWSPYRSLLNSDVADIVNSAKGGMAGASTAALFLKEFVNDPEKWIHLDVFAWRNDSAPGQPKGGEANALRAVFHFLEKRFI